LFFIEGKARVFRSQEQMSISNSSYLPMLRIILIIVLILIALPWIQKAKNYTEEKARKVEVIGETIKKAVKYNN